MLRELWEVILDSLITGDLLGHLRAWYDVQTGHITPQTRYGVAK
jgi:hypothetical protein